jgi:cobaltochelatase CobN
MQIRDGLHIFGKAPEGRLLTDLVTALARVPRGMGEGGGPEPARAIADDLGISDFDPLDCAMGEAWTGPKPQILQEVSDDSWRIAGDTVERIELLAAKLVGGEAECPDGWARTRAVLDGNRRETRRPSVEACGESRKSTG